LTERETDLELYARRRVGMVLRGKYRLERLLGVGGMAAVYKATHRNQAEFAVKLLHPAYSTREDVRTRFLREGYAANSVKHPGAVAVVDDDTAEDGAAFLVMELLDGEGVESLWARMNGRVSISAAVGIVTQLLDVLEAAHAKGIIHRDIKPANVFVLRDGTVKVLDFGIARARDAIAGSAVQTGTGVLLGTPAFMPPEQAMARASLIDARTDVWAAGATLFTLISGQVVHEGTSAAELMVKAGTAPARPILSVAPGVPPVIAQVIDRALAFEQAARWPSAASMRDALLQACRAVIGEPPTKALLAAQLGGGHLAYAPTAPAEPGRSVPPRPVSAPAPAVDPRPKSSAPPAPTVKWSQAMSLPSGFPPSAGPHVAPTAPMGATLPAGWVPGQGAGEDLAPAGVPRRSSGLLIAVVAAVVLGGIGAAVYVTLSSGSADAPAPASTAPHPAPTK